MAFQAPCLPAQGKHVDEPQLRRWLVELLLALHYMQGKQVLHRDLKSSNIFLTTENDVQASKHMGCLDNLAYSDLSPSGSHSPLWHAHLHDRLVTSVLLPSGMRMMPPRTTSPSSALHTSCHLSC